MIPKHIKEINDSAEEIQKLIVEMVSTPIEEIHALRLEAIGLSGKIQGICACYLEGGKQ